MLGACVPVVLAVADPLMGGQRPGPTVLVGAAVVTTGAMLVQGGGRADRAGLAWAVIVLLCEVGFTLLAVPALRRHGPWGVAVHSCWLAAVLLWALGAATEGLPAALTLRPAHLLVVATSLSSSPRWRSCSGTQQSPGWAPPEPACSPGSPRSRPPQSACCSAHPSQERPSGPGSRW